eukprot:TRINITY_DN4538_c0_g2_i6.p1 TRINITY_DN4538_c0_g2~~TRINITY_DN4538_c0_g2_i6.p1  ORF type:complete len:294 (+),score=49.61 TRINITY_DN4538_c0_g2_i6:201-1082(+)
MPECYFYNTYGIVDRLPPSHVFFLSYAHFSHPLCSLLIGECATEECLFKHIDPDERVVVCPWYRRGFCKHGPRCRHKHDYKEPCQNYLDGFCPKGPECPYGHPKFELPTDDELLALSRHRTALICHKCGEPGHKGSDCPNNAYEEFQPIERRAPDLSNITCYKCMQQGHYANNCPNPRVDQGNRQQHDGVQARANQMQRGMPRSMQQQVMTSSSSFNNNNNNNNNNNMNMNMNMNMRGGGRGGGMNIEMPRRNPQAQPWQEPPSQHSQMMNRRDFKEQAGKRVGGMFSDNMQF